MIAGALLAVAGFASGFIFRFVGFALVAIIATVAYAAMLAVEGSSTGGLVVAVIIALVALQVGYFAALLVRLAYLSSKDKSKGPSSSQSPNDASHTPPPLPSRGLGKLFH